MGNKNCHNLLGLKFGKLIVIKKLSKRKNGYVVWRCICDCGSTVEITSNSLTTGHTRSCGCLIHEILIKRNLKHGDAFRRKNNRLYGIWINMRQRCFNSQHRDYKYWGGKGIRTCKEWNNYLNFKYWALNNGYTKKLVIDRIDNNKDYEPNNCQWITQAENAKKSHI